MNEKLSLLINTLKGGGREQLLTKQVTVGFDGFVDTIAKIIKKKDHKASTYFSLTDELGTYILEKSGKNFSLELDYVNVKIGGNTPIMCNALGTMGASVNCIGALGQDYTHPVFKKLATVCNLHSFGDPGTAIALEFQNGKIIFSQMGSLNKMGWEQVKEKIGIDTLKSLYHSSDVFAILNWSEIETSTEIWKGMLKDVIQPDHTIEKSIFFDLSDCSSRTEDDINEMLDLLNKFSSHAFVTLGLNLNEAQTLNTILNNRKADHSLNTLAENIYKKLTIETLVLHAAKEAVAINKNGMYSNKSYFFESPKISTGAGDNFNAGFIAAQLLHCDLETCLLFGHAVSALYVQDGESPGIEKLIEFLEMKIATD